MATSLSTNGTCPTFNVVVGAAKVYIAAGGTALPANVSTESISTTLVNTAAGAAAWRYIGDTTDGVEIAFDRTTTEFEVDQFKSPVDYITTGLTISINTNLASATLNNLKLAWGYGVADAAVPAGTWGSINIGQQDNIFCNALCVVGKAPRPANIHPTHFVERVYYAKYATQLDASSFSLTKDGMTVFPVSLRVLPDPAAAGAEYGVISDRDYGPAIV